MTNIEKNIYLKILNKAPAFASVFALVYAKYSHFGHFDSNYRNVL